MIEDSIAKSRQRFAALVQDMAEFGAMRPLSFNTRSIHESPGFSIPKLRTNVRSRYSVSSEKENQPPNLLARKSVQKSEIQKSECSKPDTSLRAVNKSESTERRLDHSSTSSGKELRSQKSVDTLSEYLGVGKRKEEARSDFNQSGYVLVPRDDDSVVTSKCMKFCEDLSHLSMKIDQCSVYSVKSVKSITTQKSRAASKEMKRENKSIDAKRSSNKTKPPSLKVVPVPGPPEPVIAEESKKIADKDLVQEIVNRLVHSSQIIAAKTKNEYQLGKCLRQLSQRYGIHTEKVSAVHKRLAIMCKESANLMTASDYYLQTAVVSLDSRREKFELASTMPSWTFCQRSWWPAKPSYWSPVDCCWLRPPCASCLCSLRREKLKCRLLPASIVLSTKLLGVSAAP